MSDSPEILALIKTIEHSNKASEAAVESVKELAGDVKDLVATCNKHMIKLEHQQEINVELKESIKLVNDKIDQYVPILIKAEANQKNRTAIITSVAGAIIFAIFTFFWNINKV